MKKKKNIIILIVALVVVSISTTYAGTIIASRDVLYDNSKSGSTASDVQAAIDDLYSKADSCITGSGTSTRNYLTNYITNLAKMDKTNLAYDDTADKNLRYIGENPNNYVEFNGELWRIIGVMNNVQDANGNSASRVKLIRADSIGDIAWASNNVNNWSTASLQNLLNSGDYYNRTNTYNEMGLTSEAKSMISNVVWNLGSGITDNAVTPSFYRAERGTSVYGSNPTTWTGRVGLMYPSDYGYAIGGNVRNACLSQSLNSYNENNCYKNDWLYINNTQWTLYPMSSSSIETMFVSGGGHITYYYVPNTYVVRPVVYLNTNIKRASGSGTKTNPYILTNKETISANGKNLITYITNLSEMDTTNLAYDDTIDKNLRYIGEDPNNYIEFNNELWRIIGVMNNIKDADGKSTSMIKIIRAESIGNISLASNRNNDWSKATLQNLLNSGDYYNRTNTYSSTGLTREAKGMINSIVWNLGGRSNNTVSASTFYTSERGTTVYSGRPTTWTGYVGLMYPSDYGYAVGGDTRNTCLVTNLSSYNENNCYTNDWLYLNNADQWTLTPYSGFSSSTFSVISSGIVNYFYEPNTYAVRPVVYLNTHIEATSGSGTSDDPYTIEIG